MLVCDVDRQRLEKLAHRLCIHRNQGLPIEHGKASFQVIESGVVFSKAFFKLDSVGEDYSIQVAKLEFDPESKLWKLYVNEREDESLVKLWQPHPLLAFDKDISKLISVVESDHENCIWF